MTKNSKSIVWGVVIILIVLVGGYFAVMKKPVGTPAPVTSTPQTQTYTNDQYGFSIDLPATWKGYTVLVTGWEGRDVSGADSSGKVTENGPIITLRNPAWTTANPTEDMPIMVFTSAQWDQVVNEKIGVSAAPIPPSTLGKNSKYVLALPPRYNFDYKADWQEVDTLVHTLKAFEPK